MSFLIPLVFSLKAVLALSQTADPARSNWVGTRLSQFQASKEDEREEQQLAECDRRADARKLASFDRFNFIEQCLQSEDQQSKHH